MNGTRVARNVAAGAVAGIAAWSSYNHMTHVALHFGERPEVAYLLPLSVDGLMVVASVAMVDDKRSGRTVRWSARVAFAAGITASVGANIAAAAPNVGARIVAGWPALALLLVVELLSRSGRKIEKLETAPEPVAESTADDMPPVEEVEPDPLVPVARSVAVDLRSAGQRVTRDRIADALRQRGHPVSTDRARVLAKLVAASNGHG